MEDGGHVFSGQCYAEIEVQCLLLRCLLSSPASFCLPWMHCLDINSGWYFNCRWWRWWWPWQLQSLGVSTMWSELELRWSQAASLPSCNWTTQAECNRYVCHKVASCDDSTGTVWNASVQDSQYPRVLFLYLFIISVQQVRSPSITRSY